MVGMTVPLLPLAHQYVKTTAVPELAGRNDLPNGARLPILRHQDQDLYYREHGDRIGIGYYAHRPMPVDLERCPRVRAEDMSEHQMPSRLDFTPEDFAAVLGGRPGAAAGPARSADRATASTASSPSPPTAVRWSASPPTSTGFYVAEAVWVTHSAGIARAVAELLIDGQSQIDLHDCEVTRFEEVQSSDVVRQRDRRSRTSWRSTTSCTRCSRRSRRGTCGSARSTPGSGSSGAFFLEAGGWERPHWYEANARLLDELPAEWQAAGAGRLVGQVLLPHRRRRGLEDAHRRRPCTT